jgi:peptidoglycan-associated lipoprotein
MTTLRFRKTSWMAAAAAMAVLGLTACGPEYPNCDDDEDCHEGEFCVNGQCQQCREDSDCQAGERCRGGRCDPIEGYCTGSGDCPDGQDCENNRCVVTQSVPTDADTGAGDPGPCTIETIYFDFDSDTLSSSTRDTIQRNVECMRTRNITRLHITGYTDPQGTEEYNLALGDRRARSVQQFMSSLGVAAGNISASSVGEEMAQGEDESGWRLDRKVTFTER